uniref:Uncharacterized protein n=1 Tax=Branchiostoma floridae TaxID=7739 RepID=C3YWH5_BRAFL|eukprot:XP_002599207.1 hypothetical protein BRAFLDRAFT_117392 [Branchiostoma floridae]
MASVSSVFSMMLKPLTDGKQRRWSLFFMRRGSVSKEKKIRRSKTTHFSFHRRRSRMDSMENSKEADPEELNPETSRGKHRQDRRPSKPSNTTQVTIEVKPEKPKAERKLSRSRTLPSTPQKRRSSSADDLLRLQTTTEENNLLRLGKGPMGKSAQDCSRLAEEEPPSGPTTLCIPQIHVESTETTERRRRLLPQPPVDGSTIPTRDAAWRLEDDDNVNYLCAIDDIRIQTADTVIQELRVNRERKEDRETENHQLSSARPLGLHIDPPGPLFPLSGGASLMTMMAAGFPAISDEPGRVSQSHEPSHDVMHRDPGRGRPRVAELRAR